jgi:hypothetical protein
MVLGQAGGSYMLTLLQSWSGNDQIRKLLFFFPPALTSKQEEATITLKGRQEKGQERKFIHCVSFLSYN